MTHIDNITKYLESIGFTLTPIRIPLNGNEELKRSFYIILHRNIPFLFRFFIKFFPIKYVTERPDKSTWYTYVQNNKAIIEIGLSPTLIQGSSTRYSDILYYFRVHPNINWSDILNQDDLFIQIDVNQDDYLKKIESCLYQIDIMKIKIRDLKLDNIINGEN